MPAQATLFRQLASFSRLVRFDKRGTGMSDRVAGAPTLEQRMDDVRAVMDAVGSQRAALLGASEGGPMSILFAATYPSRCWALALWSTFPRVRWAPDYPSGDTDEEPEREIEEELRLRREPARLAELVERIGPGLDAESKRAFAVQLRQSASPGAVEALLRMNADIDVRDVLAAIRVPTLVLNRVGEHPGNIAASRYIAEHIQGARHVELRARTTRWPQATPKACCAS